MKIYFARHGETDWNKAESWQGHTNVLLNQTGVEQALWAKFQVVDKLDIAHCYTTSLSRANITAQIMMAFRGIPIEIEDDFIERKFGKYEGYTYKATEEMGYSLWGENPVLPPGCETAEEVFERVSRGYNKILERHASKDENVIIVGHGVIGGFLECCIKGLPLSHAGQIKTKNCEVVEYIINP